MASKKYISLDNNILLEWEYDSTNVSENYQIWSDLSKGSRNFISTTNINNVDHSLFVIDTAQKKFSKVDPTKFNFLKIQNYHTAPISYDKVTLYFPNDYNFGVYYGFLLKISSYDIFNRNKYQLSNYYYDKSQIQTINNNIEYADSLISLGIPFMYNQKEWSKYISFYVPSVYNVAIDRIISENVNKVTPNSINDYLTNGVGLSSTSPIYLEFSFITSKQVVFDIPYYYMGDIIKTSITSQTEYQDLGVIIQESTQGDFFEIYGYYNNSSGNIQNFVKEIEDKGGRVNIEYIVTLYEENISTFPITFLVTDNFDQKIEYRPIIKYSNTTAAIDVEMKIINLVDNVSYSRFASVGLTTNLLKYGKKLSKLDVGNLYSPKIYNYKYDKTYDNLKTSSNVTDVNIIKVPFPILIDLYKILANNYNPNISSDYKSMGLLNIILTPFDNIIKFQIAKQDTPNGPIIPYNLSEILLNSKLNLSFVSDTKNIEKDVYYQTDENKFDKGIVVFKVNQEDIPILKQMNKEKSDNFYIILTSNKTKTLLYSGKFKIFENLKFLATTNVLTGTTITSADNTLANYTSTSTTNQTNNTSSNNEIITAISSSAAGLNAIVPPQFDSNGIPIIQSDSVTFLDYYRNLILWLKAGITEEQINEVINNLNNIGVNFNYAYQTPTSTGPTIIVLEQVEVEKIQKINLIPNIVNIKELRLDFGWKKTSDKIYDFNQFETLITGTTTAVN